MKLNAKNLTLSLKIISFIYGSFLIIYISFIFIIENSFLNELNNTLEKEKKLVELFYVSYKKELSYFSDFYKFVENNNEIFLENFNKNINKTVNTISIFSKNYIDVSNIYNSNKLDYLNIYKKNFKDLKEVYRNFIDNTDKLISMQNEFNFQNLKDYVSQQKNAFKKQKDHSYIIIESIKNMNIINKYSSTQKLIEINNKNTEQLQLFNIFIDKNHNILESYTSKIEFKDPEDNVIGIKLSNNYNHFQKQHIIKEYNKYNK